MVRRTRLQSKSDDLAFPIRLKFVIPPFGLGGMHARLHTWLTAEIGARNYAEHSTTGIGGEMFAIYFRSMDDAERCLAAFPELQMADGVDSPAYYSPAKGAAHR